MGSEMCIRDRFGDNYLEALPVHADHHERTGSMWVLGTDMQDAAPNPRLNIKSITAAGAATSQIFWNVPGATDATADVQLANFTADITDKALNYLSINAHNTVRHDLVIDNTGYVGVGVVNPDVHLEVLGTNASGQLKLSYDQSNWTHFLVSGGGSGGVLTVSPSANKAIIDAADWTHLKSDIVYIGIADTDDTKVRFLGSTNNFDIDYDESKQLLDFDSSTLAVDGVNDRIGIGTTEPDKPLHIYNNIPEIKLEDAQGGYAGVQASGGNLEFYADDGNTVSNSNIVFQIDNTEWARISHLGHVGINTNSPEAPLHVKDDTGVSIFERNNDSAAYGTNVYIRKSRGTKAGGDAPANVQSGDRIGQISWSPYYGDYDNQAASIHASVEGTVGTDATPGNLVFSTTAAGANTTTERMRITSAGNVGIGVSDPDADLEIYGFGSEPNLKLSYGPGSYVEVDCGTDGSSNITPSGGRHVVTATQYINLTSPEIYIGVEEESDVQVNF